MAGPTLEELIAEVAGADGQDSPLEQVSRSVMLSEELGSLADRLVGHFVEGARAAGHSWSQIGAALGVSKQAAQQRFFEPKDPGARYRITWGRATKRFTGQALDTVERAQEAARSFRHHYLGTEHLLLGIVGDPEALGAQVLEACGVTPGSIWAKISKKVGPGKTPTEGDQQLTPRARGAFDLALGEALRMGQNRVGTEHLLLALIRDEEGLAAEILHELGLAESSLREAVVRLVPQRPSDGTP